MKNSLYFRMGKIKNRMKKVMMLFDILLVVGLFAGCGLPDYLPENVSSVMVDFLEDIQETIENDLASENPIGQESLKATDSESIQETLIEANNSEETKTSEISETLVAEETKNSEKKLEELSFLIKDGFFFAYDQLSKAEKIWYNDIAEMLGGMKKKGTLSKSGLDAGLDESSIDRIFQSVLIDHPELFYVEGYTYTKYTRGDTVLSYDFEGDYSVTKTKAEKVMQEIQTAAKEIVSGISADAGEYEKAKYAYESIILNTDYIRDSKENQNITSVFLYHESVCQGYAKAYQYLLNLMGIDCTLVQGVVNTGEGHAWNLAKINGSYYFIDCTWGDASYTQDSSQIPISRLPQINYDYLCVTTEEMNRTHTARADLNMPVCKDIKDNYYVREGSYFTSYDKNQMQNLFQGLTNGTRTEATIKCDTKACYDEIYHAMLDNQEVFSYLSEGNRTVAYTLNENQLSLSFWVTNE